MPHWSGRGSFKLISDDAYRGAPAWEEISEQRHKPSLQRANSPFFLKLPSDVSPQAFLQLIVVYEPRIYILDLTKDFFSPELWLFLYKPSKVIKMESHLVTHLMNHLLYWKESGYMKSGWSLNTKHTSFTLKKKMYERGELTYITHLTVVVGTLEQVSLLFCLRGASTHVSLPPLSPSPMNSTCVFSFTFSATSIIFFSLSKESQLPVPEPPENLFRVYELTSTSEPGKCSWLLNDTI